jgi:hypothetical protein
MCTPLPPATASTRRTGPSARRQLGAAHARLQGLALRALSDGIGFAVLPGKPSYVNRRTVTVRTFVLDRWRSASADGVLYALCAQRA